MKIAILLAFGFEEVEAIASYDVFKRLGICVDLLSVNGEPFVASNHDLLIKTNKCLSFDIIYDAIVLPGGVPGVNNLMSCSELKDFIKLHVDNNKVIGAICAAPKVLNHFGFLNFEAYTCYPGIELEIEKTNKVAKYLNQAIVKVDNYITCNGVGNSFAFGFEIAKALGFNIDSLAKKMMINN